MINYEASNKAGSGIALTFCLSCCLWRTDVTMPSHVAPYFTPVCDLREIEEATLTKGIILQTDLTTLHFIKKVKLPEQ